MTKFLDFCGRVLAQLPAPGVFESQFPALIEGLFCLAGEFNMYPIGLAVLADNGVDHLADLDERLADDRVGEIRGLRQEMALADLAFVGSQVAGGVQGGVGGIVGHQKQAPLEMGQELDNRFPGEAHMSVGQVDAQRPLGLLGIESAVVNESTQGVLLVFLSKGYLGSARKLPFLPATGAQKTPAHSFKRRRNEHQGSISNSRRSRFEQHSNVLRLVALLPHHAPLPPTETLRLSRALMCRVSVLALKCRTLSERRPMRTAATLTPMLPTGDRRMRTRVACMHAFVVHVVGHL